MKLFIIIIYLYFELFVNNILCKDVLPLSIVVPVYNTGPYLERCIKSILNQTFKEFELIFIDDASTDNSLQILEKYKIKDNRIKIIHFKKNKGSASARNAGINAAKGQFIGFIDSDDYIDERFYENLIENSKNYDIVVGNFVLSTNLSDYYEHKEYKHHWAVYDSIWRKEFLDKNNIRYDETLRLRDDTMFNRLAYKYKPRFVKLPDVGIYYYYKRRADSVRNYTEEILDKFNKRAIKKTEKKKKNKDSL